MKGSRSSHGLGGDETLDAQKQSVTLVRIRRGEPPHRHHPVFEHWDLYDDVVGDLRQLLPP